MFVLFVAFSNFNSVHYLTPKCFCKGVGIFVAQWVGSCFLYFKARGVFSI